MPRSLAIHHGEAILLIIDIQLLVTGIEGILDINWRYRDMENLYNHGLQESGQGGCAPLRGQGAAALAGSWGRAPCWDPAARSAGGGRVGAAPRWGLGETTPARLPKKSTVWDVINDLKTKKIIPVILPTVGQHWNLLYFKFEEKPFWKTIRSRKYFAANRIMCADSDIERVERYYKEGVVEYLAKPVKADQVKQRLKEMIVAHNGIVKELLGDMEGLTILHTTAGRGQFKVECLCNLCSMPLLVT
ncbi:putative histone acetyltransferase HAC-like protein 1 [Tanacetum coccineum]